MHEVRLSLVLTIFHTSVEFKLRGDVRWQYFADSIIQRDVQIQMNEITVMPEFTDKEQPYLYLSIMCGEYGKDIIGSPSCIH